MCLVASGSSQQREPEKASIGTALRFATRFGRSYRRASDRTRKAFNAAVLEEVRVRDGHVVEAVCQAPFNLLFAMPKFKYWSCCGGERTRTADFHVAKMDSGYFVNWSFAVQPSSRPESRRHHTTED